jgi:hypothetical protein
MKSYKNDIEVINVDQWNKLLIQLQNIRMSRILELIVCYTDQNPEWEPNITISHMPIVKSWLMSKRTRVENAIEQLIDARRNAQINMLSQEVFGDADTTRLKNYTEEVSLIFHKKNFEGFTHARELNFLKAFLQDHFHPEIRELCELLLVRGKWMSPALAQPFSDEFNAVLSLSDWLTRFDEGLEEAGESDGRLRKALNLAAKNKVQARQIKTILNQANQEADDIIIQSIQILSAIGLRLRNILDDYQTAPHTLIIDWKEMEAAALSPIGELISETCKLISAFLQILRAFIHVEQEAS